MSHKDSSFGQKIIAIRMQHDFKSLNWRAPQRHCNHIPMHTEYSLIEGFKDWITYKNSLRQ